MLASCLFSFSITTLPRNQRYDVVVLGNGLKESLLVGLLASSGKSVLQLESTTEPGPTGSKLNLQELAELTEGADAELSSKHVGDPYDYSIERAPKMFLAAGTQLQVLVASGAWQHMNPPGFKRVHRALMYRRRPDGKADVHRVLANSEDVVKTRMLAPLDKARAVQFFLWVERYDENDPRTHSVRPLSRVKLELHKMSAAKFLAYWEMPKDAMAMISRGIALHEGSVKSLKKVSAVEFVRKLKRYKDAYRTFSHMTSPYVYPVGGFGAGLSRAMEKVLDENNGHAAVVGAVDQILVNDSGCVCGVSADGMRIECESVVAAPEYALAHVTQRYKMVRLYAVLAHPPNLCKDAASCQLLVPAAHTGRHSDIYMSAYGPTHGVAPAGKWFVVVSARVEGDYKGKDALTVAKAELAAVLPLLKPSRKLLAEVVPYYEPDVDSQPSNLHVMASVDESSYFDSVEADLSLAYGQVTGERLGSKR